MPRPCRVVPAILTDDPRTLESMFRQAESFASYVQVDIMDGHFVPSRSITFQDMMGIKTRLDWETHLMVHHPEDYLAGFRQAGTKKAVFHFEASPEPREVIRLGRSLGLGVGLAVNPETPASALFPLVGEIDSVLLLSVHPGFYGSQFIPEVLGKITELRTARPDIEIGIDGGIKDSNITQVARAGTDVICVGSAVFLQPQPARSFQLLQSLADEGSAHVSP